MNYVCKKSGVEKTQLVIYIEKDKLEVFEKLARDEKKNRNVLINTLINTFLETKGAINSSN